MKGGDGQRIVLEIPLAQIGLSRHGIEPLGVVVKEYVSLLDYHQRGELTVTKYDIHRPAEHIRRQRRADLPNAH